jgi:hypothetical protein
MVGRRALVAACLGGVLGCSDATGPTTGFVQGDALVTLSVECLTLLVAGRTYQPVGLPDSLAVVGLRLRVAGFARDAITVCQAGPLLELTSVSRQ